MPDNSGLIKAAAEELSIQRHDMFPSRTRDLIRALTDALTAEQARAEAAEEERDRALERLDRGRDLEERNEGLKHGLKHAREKSDLAARKLAVAEGALTPFLEVGERLLAWLERLAAQAEHDAKDTRFITLSEANAADVKNFRATAAPLRRVIEGARAALSKLSTMKAEDHG